MELFLIKNTKNGMEQDVTILYKKKHQEWSEQNLKKELMRNYRSSKRSSF